MNRKSHDTRIIEIGSDIRPGASVVVIDVIRAFTCSALAFSKGAEKIMCVQTLEQARKFKLKNPEIILMGEERGLKPEGFDLGNSPDEISKAALIGRTLVQRTSNGTQGLLHAKNAPYVWATAAVNAGATARAITETGAEKIDLMVTDPTTTEDRFCAEFIVSLLTRMRPSSVALHQQIVSSRDEHKALWHRARSTQELAQFDADIQICANIDAFDVAMTGTLCGDTMQLSKQECSVV